MDNNMPLTKVARRRPVSRVVQRRQFGHWLIACVRTRLPHACVTRLKNTENRCLRDVIRSVGLASRCPESSTLSMKIDVVALIRHGASNALIFGKIRQSPLSIADIGEMAAYCQVAGPAYAFISSPRGISKGLNSLIGSVRSLALPNKLH